MDELTVWRGSGSPWSLETDKTLLKAIQDMSGDIMASMQRLESNLSNLETDMRTLSLRAGHAAASYQELCQTQFIQQEIGSSGRSIEQDCTSHSPTSTSGNYSEDVQSKYKAAVQIAAEAFSREEERREEWKPVPAIFGSPEYLQDATFGIGEQVLSESQTSIDEEEARDTLSPLPGDELPDVNEDSGEEDYSADVDVPDLRLMLEAALRGELDDGLDDLAGGGVDESLLTNSSDGEQGGLFTNPSGGAAKAGPSRSHEAPTDGTLKHGAGIDCNLGHGGSDGGYEDAGPSYTTAGSPASTEEESPAASDISDFGQNPDNWDALVPEEGGSVHDRRKDVASDAEESKASLKRLLQDESGLFK